MLHPSRVLFSAAALSGVFALGLASAGWAFGSELALAQAADSFVDCVGALVLTWVVRVAHSPRDANHPGGHTRAEPLGALAVAMLAAGLASQVALGALRSLVEPPVVQLDALLLWLFVGKVVFKGAIVVLARQAVSPALRALSIDATNDLLVGAVSVVGYIGAKAGFPQLDAWLALPVAVWIGWSGLRLARDNIDLLMGVAPSVERQTQLLELIRAVDGVLDAHDLRAQFLGASLAVHVHITVNRSLSLQQAHDIGENVRQLLEAQADVHECSVHIDPQPEINT